MHELNSEHEPEAADLTDRLVSFGDALYTSQKLRSPLTCVGHQPSFDKVQRRKGRGAAHRISAERPAVRAGGPRHHALARHDRADRHARAESFCGKEDVGLDLVVLAREHPPFAPNTALNLVAHEQDAVPVAELAKRREEPSGRDDISALALDRLDEDGCDITWIDAPS